MDNPSQVSEEESWNLAYSVFVFTLEALASTPEEACKAMGSVNTAWELQADALAGRYLLGSGHFSNDQERAVQLFLDGVSAVPVNDMPGGRGLQPNLAAMQHSSWQPVRESAGALLEVLASITQANRAYLESLNNAP